MTPAGRFVDPSWFIGTDLFGWVTDGPPGLGYIQTEAIRYHLPRSVFGGFDFELHPNDDSCFSFNNNDPLVLSDGVLWLPGGFYFDGASGPAIDGVCNMLAALIHDALYAIRAGGCEDFTYQQADAFYRDTMIIQKAGRTRAWVHYVALRGFGWLHRLRG